MQQTRTKKFQQMLSNIANDLDLLLTDLCQLYPFPGANSPMKSSFQPPQDTDNLNKHGITNTRGQNSLGNSKSSIGSESSSDQTLTSDSGHDDKTPDRFSPETTLYHVEDITQLHHKASDTPDSTDSSRRPITLLERISKTHSIWLLPEIGRTGAVHILKDRETGTFIVRKSSQKDSLALSVEHRHDDKSTVDHYLIENSEYGMTLQGSHHVFKSIPHLIAYYVQHKDELPNLLVLPVAILNAKTSQELSALSMLGQDFWLSKVSHCTMSDLSCGAPLQKSCSEPINITVPSHNKQPPVDMVSSTTSQSLNDFSKFMKKHITTQPSMDAPQLPPRTHNHIKLVHGDIANVVSHKFEESENRVHVTHTTLVNGGEQIPEHTEFVSQHKLKGYKEQVDLKSQTHPRVTERGKFSHHFTTSLDLLHIPEQSYFRSDLSDKMSDYEDIWKNSLSETESNNKNNITCNISTQTTNSPGPFIPTVHNVLSPLEEEHLPKCNIHKAIAMGTITTQNDQKRTLSQDNIKTKQCQNHAVLLDKGRAQPNKSTVSVTATTENRVLQSQEYTSTMQIDQPNMSSSIPLSQNLNSAPKTKPPPLPRLSRIKSSSTSSLSTTASPVYAEPADAVDFKGSKGQAISVRIRRCSAPSAPFKLQEQWKKMDIQKTKPLESQVAKKTRLDTIFSPRMLQEHVELSNHGDEVFSFEARLQNRPPLAESSAHRKGVQRSQSLKVAAERKTKLSRHRSWRERFSKLKLDSAQKDIGGGGGSCHKTLDDQNTQGLCKLDDVLFSLENLENNSDDIQNSTLRKFPVYKKKPPTEKDTTGNRASCFSDSSTVQDLISCALPNLAIRPIIPLTLANLKRVSEYDNLLNIYAPPSATSSAGTVFCKPWDNQPWEKLLPSGCTELQKDMSANERVKMWKMAHIDTHDGVSLVSDTDTEAVRTSSTIDNSVGAHASHNPNHNVESCHAHSQHHSRYNTQFCQLNRKPSDQTDSCHANGGSKDNNIQSSDSMTGLHCLDSRIKATCNHNDYTELLEEEAVFGDDISFNLNAQLKDRMRPIVSHSSTLPHCSNSPGAKIRDYIFRLSQDRSTTFGSTIENFIQCTLDSQETNPHTVMRNVRQFMTGIKNYLVKHGEGQLEDLIERERKNLGASEILNIDALIEGALHVCVIRPVKHHIYRLFVEDHNKNGNLQLMVINIKYARSKSPQDIGIKSGVLPPHGSDLELIKHCLDKMQRAYSPLKKLENLLAATAVIYHCGQDKQHGPQRGPASLGADDFLPMLIYVLVHCGIVSAEIEADYMWGLLHPTLLSGEGGYYLTTLSSAVLVLKHFQETQQTKLSQHKGHLPSVGDTQGFLKIAIPDEVRDSIIWKTLPVRPNMTTKEVCAMIAHKFKITSSQDYSLFLLVNGEETQLADGLCPQMIKGEYIASGADVVFAYKRTAANIAWPTNMVQSSDR